MPRLRYKEQNIPREARSLPPDPLPLDQRVAPKAEKCGGGNNKKWGEPSDQLRKGPIPKTPNGHRKEQELIGTAILVSYILMYLRGRT